MKLIENVMDIKNNIDVIDRYVKNKKEPEYGFALSLIKRGTCFICYITGDTYKFYPSRFIGYKSNNMNSHLNNESKDGKETNPVISEILKTTPIFYPEIEQKYYNYCGSLGFKANAKGAFGVQRKYWLLHNNVYES